jgi:hypothetical protein
MFGNLMNFEIAPKETEIRANWYDAKLYCFSLNIDGKTGWRLPTDREFQNNCRIRGWYLNEQCPEPLPVTPVRDLKDD